MTKAQRLKCYRIVKETLNPRVGLCIQLRNVAVSKRYMKKVHPKLIAKEFPELWRRRPRKELLPNEGWWPLNKLRYARKRIKVLNGCIKSASKITVKASPTYTVTNTKPKKTTHTSKKQ